MKDWDFSSPPRSELGDHDVRSFGKHLEGKRVALMISGGIAAIQAPFIARALRKQGATVVAYASKEGLRYTTEDSLEWSTTNPVITRLSPSAEHLHDAERFDGYLVAPATYNTINKVALGIADGVLTATLAAALGRMVRGDAKVLIAPTMHGDMHTPILTDSMKKLSDMGVRIIPPREDYGKHNIPDTETLVAEVCAELSTSPLKGRRILVTGGPTPVPIDNVRLITNRFTGKLGTAIADELTLRGAQVQFVLGKTGLVRRPISSVPAPETSTSIATPSSKPSVKATTPAVSSRPPSPTTSPAKLPKAKSLPAAHSRVSTSCRRTK